MPVPEFDCSYPSGLSAHGELTAVSGGKAITMPFTLVMPPCLAGDGAVTVLPSIGGHRLVVPYIISRSSQRKQTRLSSSDNILGICLYVGMATELIAG